MQAPGSITRRSPYFQADFGIGPLVKSILGSETLGWSNVKHPRARATASRMKDEPTLRALDALVGLRSTGSTAAAKLLWNRHGVRVAFGQTLADDCAEAENDSAKFGNHEVKPHPIERELRMVD